MFRYDNCNLSHYIIDSFPQLLKWKIKVKPVFPERLKAWADKTVFFVWKIVYSTMLYMIFQYWETVLLQLDSVEFTMTFSFLGKTSLKIKNKNKILPWFFLSSFSRLFLIFSKAFLKILKRLFFKNALFIT